MANRFLPLLDSNASARRRFLVGCVAVAGTSACSGATTAFETDAGGDDGPSGGDDGSAGDDAAGGDDTTSDAPASTCPSAARDTGKAPSDFGVGVPVYLAAAVGFVVRDAMGLYGLTAVCTHQGCTVRASGGGGFTCPCHGATFSVDGVATGGPAHGALKHYALCLTESGTVAIDTSTVVDVATRYGF